MILSISAFAKPGPLVVASIDDAPYTMSRRAQNITDKVPEIVTDTVSFTIKFRVGSSVIDPEYSNNSVAIANLNAFLEKVVSDTLRTVHAMRLCGSVSPEGTSRINNRLVVERAEAIRNLIRKDLSVEQTSRCRVIPMNVREIEQMAIAREISVVQLYEEMRYARVDFVVDVAVWPEYSEGRKIEIPEYSDDSKTIITFRPGPVNDPIAESPIPHNIYVKTNLIGWGMAIGNIAGEIDFGDRWSAVLPIYYSGWNYFSQRVKFRTFILQPEFRYWIKGHRFAGTRWFVGVHAGIGWYNFALGNDYRIQDVGGHTPSLGGGISGGVRIDLPWGGNNRWKMEFTLGAGVYRAKYDKFYNYSNGQMAESSISKTFFGIDNAAVSIVYTLPN